MLAFHYILKNKYSRIAQSVERLTVNQDVVGSSPTVGAKVRADDKSHLLFVVLAIYIAWLLIKMEPVNSAKAE